MTSPTTRTRWIALICLVAFVGVLGGLALLPPRPGVTKTNFDRIKDGMTRREVKAIFGPSAEWSMTMMRRDEYAIDENGGIAQITFDEKDRVVDRNWLEWPDDRGLFESWLDHLPWREKKPDFRRLLIAN
jgi:hypothetical protein